MTIRTTKPAINLREELASLRNQGGYSEQQFYFDGLLENGNFESALTGWVVLAGGTSSLSISGGEAQIVKNSATASDDIWGYSNIRTVAGSTYVFKGDLRRVSGSATAKILAYNGNTQLSSSSYVTSTTAVETSITFTAGSNLTQLRLVCGGGAQVGTAGFDNLSVFETDGTDVIYSMPTGWKPKDVFEDGLLQREGSGEDYTVIDNGFDYIIKPTVAPTASTQTTVIGVKA